MPSASVARGRRPLAAWAGLVAAPSSWYALHVAISILSPWQCTGWPLLTPTLAAVAAVLTAAGGVVSWWSLRTALAVGEEHRHRFVAWLGVAASLLFLFVIACQGAAGLVYSGCER
jgi:hypothetical protein